MLRALLLAFVIAAPTATALWRGAGGFEPDTPEDVTGTMMFLEPDASADVSRHAVYFQAFTTAPETSLNPNLGLTGTRLLFAPTLHHRAFLGEWKDCNNDGYIGLAESAIQDYPARLLLDDVRCPATTGAPWPVHNDGLWVSELLFIGMVDPCEFASDAVREAECPGIDAFARNERVHYANGTFVWGDLGLPGSIPKTECILAPLPSGATTSTGAMLGWADCQSRRGLAETVNEADADGSLGLRFEDTQSPEDSSSLLNQRFPVTPFGRGDEPGILQDDTSAASASVWDCGDDPVAEVEDPEGRREIALADPTGQLGSDRFPLVVVYALTGLGFEDEDGDDATPGVFRRALTDDAGRYAVVPDVDARLHDPTASSWVAIEALVDGPAGDCDPATESALAPAYVGHAVESDATPILEARKDRTSVTFTFYDGHRGLHPELDPYTGETTPSDGGTLWLDHGRGGDGPMWSALAQSEQDPQLVNREDLGFTPRLYFTYYARIGPTSFAFTLPSDTQKAYGAENCGEATGGVVRGWVCDPALWWRDAEGNSNAPKYAQGLSLGRVPGDVYHLRDIDCYDGDVARGVGLHASLVDLSGDAACPFNGAAGDG